MNARYTQGPWQAVAANVIRPDGQIIAECGIDMDQAEANANAQLIAAAPELFNCVAGFVSAWQVAFASDEDINGANAVEWLGEVLPLFQASLRKAKGVQS